VRHFLFHVACVVVVLGFSAPDVFAQGSFTNFESPTTHAVQVATVSNGVETRHLLLAVNTPDSSLEVYDAESPYSFVARRPVGLEPVAVFWNADLKRFYTCNFAGDSVTVGRIVLTPFGLLQIVIERTVLVGNEPSFLALVPGTPWLYVCLQGESAVQLRHAVTLDPVLGKDILDLPEDGAGAPCGNNPCIAVKSPRRIEILSDLRFLCCNLMTDLPTMTNDPNDDILPPFELGMYLSDPAVTPGRQGIRGLGTTNTSFAVAPDERHIFVVGSRARHLDEIGEPSLAVSDFGFVESWMWVIDAQAGQGPHVQPEAATGLGLPTDTMRSINLNRRYGVQQGAVVPVGKNKASSGLADIALYDLPGQAPFGSVVEKIFISASHSDKILVLQPDTLSPGGYGIRRLDLQPIDSSRYGMVGPRSLHLSMAVTPPGEANAGTLFVHNSRDNSIAVYAADSETEIARFALQNDPTPEDIRLGRKFLYSAEFSASSMVSCASCHVEGRTDGLAWNLGQTMDGPQTPAPFFEGNEETQAQRPLFKGDKGRMVTQTLQGLVNCNLVSDDAQHLFTNAPYHWRGDRFTFNDFNQAFVGLMGRTDRSNPGEDPRGISKSNMELYRRFIETIVHPPNPEQCVDRQLCGTLGADPNQPIFATGALSGLSAFHTSRTVQTRSCVNCHSLPEGSSNNSNLVYPVDGTLLQGVDGLQLRETAQLRSLFQREASIDDGLTDQILFQTGRRGLMHNGVAFADPNILGNFESINHFIQGIFDGVLPDLVLTNLTHFVREFDTGIAPAVGMASVLHSSGDATPVTSCDFTLTTNQEWRDFLQGQVADANIGLKADLREAGDVLRSYYYDLTAVTPVYREEGGSGVKTPDDLLTLAAAGDLVILQATPLGAERRMASPTGVAAQQGGPNPANVTLEPMAPGAQWVEVTQFTKNIDDDDIVHINLLHKTNMWSMRQFRNALQAGADTFGVPATGARHEAPRRFRVTGDNILPGAVLRLGPSSAAGGQTGPDYFLEMHLFPTGFSEQGRQVWETDCEMAPVEIYASLCGGRDGPHVQEVLDRSIDSPMLDPTGHNFWFVEVQNEDDKKNLDASWQRLRIQDLR
jgi:hypothetical protein